MKPYFEDMVLGVVIYCGDCREIVGDLPEVDVAITDPPYGETSLLGDRWIPGWSGILPTNNLWCFGSMRLFMKHATEFFSWKFAQDVVWEKSNGSTFHSDRFRRVHEHVSQFYKGAWKDIYKSPVRVVEETPRTIRHKRRPTHAGHVEWAPYASNDGGPRLERSVLRVASCHGYAEHPTQKPLGIISPLVEYSCPENGVVLDPFMGSGTTLIAAVEAGKRAIGIEINEEYCEVAVKRLMTL